MQASWTQSIAWILEAEGPELNVNDGEPGGASRYGVSVAALTDFYTSQGKPPATLADVTALTAAQAEDFYVWFLTPINFAALPVGIDYRLADITVALGREGGKEAWETIVARPSGTIINVRDVICALGAYGIGFKHAQADAATKTDKSGKDHWKEFQVGWTKRYHQAEAQALGLAKLAVLAEKARRGSNWNVRG
jgi:lysozyme family protein